MPRDSLAPLTERILARLRSREPRTFRAGGRSVALQILEQRSDAVLALRAAIGDWLADETDARRRGYGEALEDMLVAAEASFEQQQRDAKARQALGANDKLQHALDLASRHPITPSDLAKQLEVSASTGTRLLADLRDLELATQLPGSDARVRPHVVTPLGRRLAAPIEPAKAAMEIDVEAPAVMPEAPDVAKDPLTGALGWKTFERVVNQQLDVYGRAKRNIAFLRVDVASYRDMVANEHFATVEGRIKEVSDRLEKALTHVVPASCITRYAEDQFIAFTPSVSPEQAKHLAESIRSQLAPTRIHIGIGGTISPDATLSTEKLMWASGKALQRAKESGPTKWCEWEDAAPGPAATMPAVGRRSRTKRET
jgi:GGDEF domain-containing protein